MLALNDTKWQRRGFSLLWGPEALASFARPEEAATVREFFNMSRAWPDALPSSDGDALVVAGLEGCLDSLAPADAEEWLRSDLKEQVLRFQSEYQNDAALIFWLPGGRQRVRVSATSDEINWVCGGQYSSTSLPLGRCLWGGAQSNAVRIVHPPGTDPDGQAWAGLYHPRIS